jgi:hypothetical protein
VEQDVGGEVRAAPAIASTASYWLAIFMGQPSMVASTRSSLSDISLIRATLRFTGGRHRHVYNF